MAQDNLNVRNEWNGLYYSRRLILSKPHRPSAEDLSLIRFGQKSQWLITLYWACC